MKINLLRWNKLMGLMFWIIILANLVVIRCRDIELRSMRWGTSLSSWFIWQMIWILIELFLDLGSLRSSRRIIRIHLMGRLLIRNWSLTFKLIFKMKIISIKTDKSLITTRIIIYHLEIHRIQQLIDKVKICNLPWVINYKTKKTII
jgi:hypothetical protein